MVAVLTSLIDGGSDVYEGYRALYALWCSNNAAVPELRPLFRIRGCEPDGAFAVTESWRNEVRSLAMQILSSVSD